METLRAGAQHEQARVNLALALGVFGSLDDAFALMEKISSDVASLIELRADPLLAPLRADARYRALLRRIGAQVRGP